MIRLKIALAVLAALLAGVPHGRGVQRASSKAPAAAASTGEANAVNGGRPLLPPSPLTLKGEVLGLPSGAPLSQVYVWVGGTSYPASVAGSTFTVEVPTWVGGDMVVLDARAPGGIALRALAGSARRLARLAGSDEIATVGEAPGLRVNAWTTATAATLRARLDRDPISDAEIEQAHARVRMADIGAIAFLLDSYSTGARALPAGFSSGYEVVTTPSALRMELAPITAGSNFWTSATRDFVRTLPVLAPLGNAGEMPPSLLARSELPDDLPQSPETYLLSRRSDGKYDFFGGAAVETPYAGTLAGGVFGIVPDGVVRSRLRATRPFAPSNVMVDIERTLHSIEWRRMFDGDEVDAWIVVWTWLEQYPGYPNQPPQLASAASGVTSTDFSTAIDRTAWSTLTGQRRSFPTTCFRTVDGLPQLQVCDTALHRFDAGGSGITEDVGLKVDAYMRPKAGAYGSAFQWRTQSDGSLVIETPDSRTVAWSTHSIDGVNSIVYYTWKISTDATQSFLGTTLSVADSIVPFGAPQAQGVWGSGFVLSAAFEYPASGSRLEFTRNADGVGEYLSASEANPAVRLPQKWSIQGERIWELRSRARYSNGSQQYVLDCEAAFNAGAVACSPASYRYFRPLRRVGNRLYGIEELHLQSSIQPRGYAGTYDVTVSTRANYQGCLSGGCTAYATAAAPSLPLDTPALAPMSRPLAMNERESHAHLRLRMRRLR